MRRLAVGAVVVLVLMVAIPGAWMPTVVEVTIAGDGAGVEYNQTAVNEILGMAGEKSPATSTDPPDSAVEGPTTPTPDPTTTETQDGGTGGVEPATVEQAFLDSFNDWRREQGLPEVTVDDELTEMGRAHSKYMADTGELTHVEAGGVTIEDRFRQRGLLPACRIDLEGSDRFYPGAENAAQTWIYTNVRTESGIVRYSDAEELAEGLLRQWLNSPGHRKPMVQSDVDEIGLGVVITEHNEVWASLEFC